MDLLKIRRQLCNILILDLNNKFVYFDVEKEEFDYLDEEMFQDFYQKYDCIEDINQEELKGYDNVIFNLLIHNNEKVISVMPCHFNNVKELAIEFINNENNSELNASQSEKFYLNKFLYKINELNLKEKWLDFVYSKEYNAIDHLIDGLGIYEIEARKELYLKLYELANTINELKPWEIFSDCDFIEYDGEVEKYYYCVMGNAGQTFGLSIYSKDDLDGLHTIVNNIDDQIDPLLLMSMQMNYTIYFDELDKNREEYLFLKELGIEDKYNHIISLFRFKHGVMNRAYLTYNEAYELMNRLENFIKFYKAYKENPIDFDCDKNIHIKFNIKKKVNISKTNLDNNYNCLLDCSAIPLLENINFDQTATYEIDLRGFKVLSIDEKGKKSAATYLMMIVDATTGMILKPIMIDGSRSELFYDIYIEMQEYIKNNNFAMNVVVRNEFVANLLGAMFGDDIKVKIGKFNYLDEAYDYLNHMIKKDRVYN